MGLHPGKPSLRWGLGATYKPHSLPVSPGRPLLGPLLSDGGTPLLGEVPGFSLDGCGVLRVASLAPSCSPGSEATWSHLAALTLGQPSPGLWWLLAHGSVCCDPFHLPESWRGLGGGSFCESPCLSRVSSQLASTPTPHVLLSQGGGSLAPGLPSPLLTGSCQAAHRSCPVF